MKIAERAAIQRAVAMAEGEPVQPIEPEAWSDSHSSEAVQDGRDARQSPDPLRDTAHTAILNLCHTAY